MPSRKSRSEIDCFQLSPVPFAFRSTSEIAFGATGAAAGVYWAPAGTGLAAVVVPGSAADLVVEEGVVGLRGEATGAEVGFDAAG